MTPDEGCPNCKRLGAELEAVRKANRTQGAELAEIARALGWPDGCLAPGELSKQVAEIPDRVNQSLRELGAKVEHAIEALEEYDDGEGSLARSALEVLRGDVPMSYGGLVFRLRWPRLKASAQGAANHLTAVLDEFEMPDPVRVQIYAVRESLRAAVKETEGR